MFAAVFILIVAINVAMTAYLFNEIRRYNRELAATPVSPAPADTTPDVRSESVVPALDERPVEPEPGAVALLKALRGFLQWNADRVQGADSLDGRVVTVGLVTTGSDGRAACDVIVDRLPGQGASKIDIRAESVAVTLTANRAASVDGFVL